ncbi:MAG: 4Fe-4S dicluster domain-containing protein, partial [Ignisphaera sp.]|nr:4Fe-4S dicluster domain-containing protein [Ignisphaera sp.]
TIEADLVIEAVGETPTPPIYSSELAKCTTIDSRLNVGSDYRIPGTNIFAVGDVVTGPSKIGFAVDHTLKAIRVIDGIVSGEKIRIEDLVKRLKKVEKSVVRFAEWRDSIADEICRYLGSYAEVKLESCLALSPFVRIFSYTKCIGCETCSTVCGFIHDGKSFLKIRKSDDGLVFPTSCLHCANAKCVAVCRKNAIIRGDLGEVLIDYRRCNKCMDCLNECPIKAMRISRGDVVNCNLCQPLRRGGLEPACISMCPSKTIAITRR